MNGSWPAVIAHRAGNDLASLRAAEEAGADVVEADVWYSRGSIEVRHLKTMGPVPLLWDRWKLASAGAPRFFLDQLLAAARPETHFMLDLKGNDRRLPSALVEAVATSGRESALTVCSQSWDLLDHFRDLPGVRVAHSVGSPGQLARVMERLTWHDRHVVSVHFRLLNPGAVEGLRQRANAIITWPINTPGRLRTIRAWGLDGFTSDNLGLIRDYVAQRMAAGIPRD